MKKIKVTAVSYLNTKPFLYGIFQSPIQDEIELSLDIPSECARKLQSGEADLGIVPVAVIPKLATPHIISDYCIGAVGAVTTVCIYSDVPMAEISALYLDFHSKTSVALAKLLLDKYWRHNPVLLDGTEGYISKIGGNVAGLVIGDRTIGLSKQYKYVYDLGEMWQKYTGLPFVFAAWVANRELDADFINRFNVALKIGLDHIPQLVYLLPTQSKEFDFDLTEYFTHHISYNFDAAKKIALQRFLTEIDTKVMVEAL